MVVFEVNQMNINTLIDELQEFCNKSDNNINKMVYTSFQKDFLEGQAGAIINSMDDSYEVYLYIKNKDKIASPLAYIKTNLEKEANTYYTKLISVIKNENPKELIEFCRNQK